MGAPSAQVQSSQSSQPASKGAGISPSTPSQTMSLGSAQPSMGQPNTNGNSGLQPVNAGYMAPTDGATSGLPNPYPNTIGGTSNSAGQPMGKGSSGSNFGAGKSGTNP